MSRILAWCAGASAGYVAGWLAGSAVRDRVEARRLGRPQPRTGPGTGGDARGALIGPQNGAQRCADVDIWSYQHCARVAGHRGSHVDASGLTAWGTREPPIPAVIREAMAEAAPPCAQRSPGGGLVCCQEGPHRAHLFLGTGGPDRKEDADTEVDA